MAEILIGQFDERASADAAAVELRDTGVASSDVEVFMLGAPGQHDSNPEGIGGDRPADPEATAGHTGALAGAALGGTAGLAVATAAVPLVGPLALAAGAAIGAYAGSLAGAVNNMGDATKHHAPPIRPAGMRVAVRIGEGTQRALAQQVFARRGARSIEEASGRWQAGKWIDFDPKSIPHWVLPPPAM
jgi:hypothetical protein